MPGLLTFRPIRGGDYQRRARTAHPSFVATNISATTSSGYSVYKAVFNYAAPEISSSNYLTNSDGTFQPLIWNSINQLYYELPYEPYGTMEHYVPSRTTKTLFYSASLISVPYLLMGEKIKSESVVITGSTSAGTQFYLQDDKYGNLEDSAISTTNFAPSSNLLGYWSFNNEYRYIKTVTGTPVKNTLEYQSNVFDPLVPATVKDVIYTTGLTSSGTTGSYHGLVANFNGSTSYIATDNNDNFKWAKDKNWAISFWAKISNDSIPNRMYMISKQGTETVTELGLKRDIIKTSKKNIFRNRYPFFIGMSNSTSKRLLVERSDGSNTVAISSSMFVDDNTYRHYVVQKTGSNIELYVNGALDKTITDSTVHQTYNNSDIIFGALNISGSNGFSGSMAEIRMYNTALTTDQVSSLANAHYLSGSLFQTNVVGNVFYRSGNIVISSPHAKYSNTDVLNNTWTLNYNGSQRIYEHEILVRVPKDTFNLSFNPTVLQSPDSDLISGDFRTGSLKPYISTIGLYNDKNEMVAVAKMAQPIQKRDDIDLNFIVRFDT